MCLGVPGRIVSIEQDPRGAAMGTVSFGGITRRVCLACVPEAGVGDHVIVHAGFAISRIDEARAAEVFRLLEEIAETDRAGAGAEQGASREDD